MKKKFMFYLFNFLVKVLFKKSITLLNHNGEDIQTYPSSQGWYMVPFPKEKGLPFCADNLATTARHKFKTDKMFNLAQNIGESRWGNEFIKKRDISWRLDIMLSVVSHALKISDKSSIFVECGTGKGYMAAAICEYFKNESYFPNFYLFDSFLPNVPDNNGNQNTKNTSFVYSNGDEEVKSYFKKYDFVKIIKGFLPHTLQQLPLNTQISFLHIDLNNHTAELNSINFLKSKLMKGAIVLFDDYGGYGAESQAEVHEKFAQHMNSRLFTLPTGQAFYIH
jgi:hypothetical protein